MIARSSSDILLIILLLLLWRYKARLLILNTQNRPVRYFFEVMVIFLQNDSANYSLFDCYYYIYIHNIPLSWHDSSSCLSCFQITRHNVSMVTPSGIDSIASPSRESNEMCSFLPAPPSAVEPSASWAWSSSVPSAKYAAIACTSGGTSSSTTVTSSSTFGCGAGCDKDREKPSQ